MTLLLECVCAHLWIHTHSSTHAHSPPLPLTIHSLRKLHVESPNRGSNWPSHTQVPRTRAHFTLSTDCARRLSWDSPLGWHKKPAGVWVPLWLLESLQRPSSTLLISFWVWSYFLSCLIWIFKYMEIKCSVSSTLSPEGRVKEPQHHAVQSFLLFWAWPALPTLPDDRCIVHRTPEQGVLENSWSPEQA